MNREEFQEQAKSFIELQLSMWPEAKARWDAFTEVKRAPFRAGCLEGFVQFNPSRKRSTAADVSAQAIAERPCFLCESNRPKEQIGVPIKEGWTLLLNPFPILPVHFTIASDTHRDQHPDIGDLIEFAERMAGMAVFFNGIRAGASAPDHLHYQAVPADELPLLRKIMDTYPADVQGIFSVTSKEGEENGWPFAFTSAVIHIGKKGEAVLRQFIETFRKNDDERMNLFVWIGMCGELRLLLIPRPVHRPECYNDPQSPVLVSPGAIDMAGLIVTVRVSDFERVPEMALSIYRQVGE